MPTSIGGLNIVTKGTGHVAPGPPAVSLIPPTPPAGPVPSPFLYIAESKNASKGLAVKNAAQVDGNPIVCKGTLIDIDPPANVPADVLKALGGDVVTKATKSQYGMVKEGVDSTLAKKKKISVTTNMVALNVVFDGQAVYQVSSPFIEAGDFNRACTDQDAFNALKGKLVYRSDPVSVSTGDVIDEVVDLTVPGIVPIEWRRSYSSRFNTRSTSMGRGWVHAYDQRLEPGEKLSLWDSDGRRVVLPTVERGEVVFDRRSRLEVTRSRNGVDYEVYSLDTRLIRSFSPLVERGVPRLRSLRDRFGNRVDFAYTDELLVSVVESTGRELRITWHGRRIVAVDVVANGRVLQHVAYCYDDAGDLIEAIDPAGQSQRYAYDGNHRMREKALKSGLRFRFLYDVDSGRCVRAWGDGGFHEASLTYDLKARCTYVSGSPRPSIYTWDPDGAVLSEKTYGGESKLAVEYDVDGKIIGETDAAGNKVEHEYDARGNRTKTTLGDGSVLELEYQDDRVVKRVGPDGSTTKLRLGASGEPIEIVYPNGEILGLEWDGRGLLLGIYGDDGRRVAFGYDEHGFVRVVQDIAGETRWERDALGRPLAVVDVIGRVRKWTYDALGRCQTDELPDGGRWSFVYDALDNVTQVTAPDGSVQTRTWQGVHGRASWSGFGGRTYTYRIDTLEQLRSIRNARGESWELRYDRAGRVREETRFDGALLRYVYDRSDRATRTEFEDETWIDRHYDAGGRVLREDSPHGSLLWGWDAASRTVQAVVEEPGTPTVVEIERDIEGHIVAESQNGRIVRYEYDGRGRRTARILPTGHTTRYHYDARGFLTSIDHEGHRVSFVRDAAGRELKRYFHGPDVEVTTTLDAHDRVLERAVRGRLRPDGTRPVLSRRAWERDTMGRPVSCDDLRWGLTRYAHDASGALTMASGPGGREVYEHDAAGYLVSNDDPSAAQPWVLRPGNVLKRTPHAEYEYDDRRRRIRRIADDGAVTEYVWDCRDRLRDVHLPSGEKLVFTYDASGRRVRKVVVPAPPPPNGPTPVPSRVVEYLWDGDQLAAEIDSERGLRVFVWLFEPSRPHLAQPLLQQDRDEVLFYVTDHLGQPKDLVDATGDVVWSATHTAFGSEIQSAVSGQRVTPPRPPPFRHLGQYHDEETGLGVTKHRAFDAQVGRWLSADPLGRIGGPDLFGFNGSPVQYVDPLGLEPDTVPGYPTWPISTYGADAPGLQRHELLQNTWLAQNGLSSRQVGDFSTNNPTLNVPQGTHTDIHNNTGAAAEDGTASANDAIAAGAQGLRAAGVPEPVVQEMIKRAQAHAPRWVCS